MTLSPFSKQELADALRQIQHTVADLLATTPLDSLNAGSREDWSAADYLKHMIISSKPIAKAMGMSHDTLGKTFGEPDHASKTYAGVVAQYQARLDAGMRAEDAGDGNIVPWSYRFPADVTVGDADSEFAHLKQAWQDANNRLIANMDLWDETALDTYQLPHPAIGLQTMREMLMFTVYHNTLHAHDMQNAIQKAKA
jgi:uncharacterized damage-inducible protein DinB